jgi:hypothetical protein
MKLFLGIFLALLPMVASALTIENELSQQQQNELSNRFVTSIKEAEIDSKMLQVEQIKQIVEKNKITDADVKIGSTATQPKIDAAKQEFEQAFATLNEDQVKQLSEKLNLDSYGFVKGKESKAMMEFFSKRIQNAVYGTGATGQALQLKEKVAVDHKIYNELYITQLGKNILLEISNYCYNNISPDGTAAPASTAAFNKWVEILGFNSPANQKCKLNDPRDNLAGCLSSVSDTVAATSASGTTPDPYLELSQKLAGLANKDAPKILHDMFVLCTRLIPHLCESNAYCNAADKTPWINDKLMTAYTCPSDKKKGEISCVVQSRLKTHRTNLEIAKKSKEQYERDYDETKDPKFKIGLDKDRAKYDLTVRGEKSIESISALTSQDLNELAEKVSKETEDKFTQEQCENAPESKECEIFFSNAEQATRLKNSQLGYTAATELEKKRIDLLKTDETKLKEYLTQKGYTDLAAQLSSANLNNIVAIAKERFAAEREASFASMSAAFERKQILDPNNKTANAVVATKAKDEIKSKTSQTTQLMLFNNVVTSYLQIETNGKRSTNSQVLARETEALKKGENIDAAAMTFFSNLGGAGGGSGSSGGGTDEVAGASFVDLSFIDNILGDKKD